MSITVAAALKKVAAAVLTDKKAGKTVVGVVLAVILIVIFPIVGVTGALGSLGKADTAQLQAILTENLSEQEITKLQTFEDTMRAIESAMAEAGFASRTREAQAIYALLLSNDADDSDMIEKLVACFSAEQSDEQLLANVNAAFEIEIPFEDFVKIMQSVRAVYIDTSHYVDPSTKNNLDLVQWAIVAEKAGWGYVWGACGQVLTESALASKVSQYPDEVGSQEKFIRTHWRGRRCADRVGFIKGYGWLNAETLEIEYGTNGMPDIGADAMYANATEKGMIDTIPEIPGLAVWQEGHIGIYIGNGEVIEAMGTRYGVVRTQLSERHWTHWLKIPYINYIEETEEPYEESSDYDYP